jgi:hypothetical protein
MSKGASQNYEVNFDIFHIKFTVRRDMSYNGGLAWISVDSVAYSIPKN